MDAETAGRFFSDPKLLAAWSALGDAVLQLYEKPYTGPAFDRISMRIRIEKQMDCVIETQRIYDRLGL